MSGLTDRLKPHRKRIAKLRPDQRREFERLVAIHADYDERYGIGWNAALVEKWLKEAEKGAILRK